MYHAIFVHIRYATVKQNWLEVLASMGLLSLHIRATSFLCSHFVTEKEMVMMKQDFTDDDPNF